MTTAPGSDGWPSAVKRVEISRPLLAASGELTTAALARIAAEHPWFAELDAENRSWISLVAKSGIDGFLTWFASGGERLSPGNVFDAAPRAVAGARRESRLGWLASTSVKATK